MVGDALIGQCWEDLVAGKACLNSAFLHVPLVFLIGNFSVLMAEVENSNLLS